MREDKAGSQGHQEILDADLQSAIADLLDLDKADIEANSDSTFIQLGGNSVKALELTFRLDAVGKSLDVETILEEKSDILSLSRGLLQESNDTPEDQVASSTESDSDTTDPQSTPASHSAPVSPDANLNLIKEASHQLSCPEGDIEHVLSLTSQQRGLWLGSLQVPGAYISHWKYRIEDDIDEERLSTAWRRVLEVNPILRTRVLAFSDSTFRQVVLSNHHYKSRDDLLRRQKITADEGAPLFSYNIENQGKSRVLILDCHHILYDRWSMRLILQDIEHAYRHDGTLDPRPSYLPFLEPLSEASAQELLESWREITQDETIVPAPTVHSSDNFSLASDICEVTATPGPRKNATHAALIAAAWSFVCSKYCDSPCVSFGLTVWGRDAQLAGITKMTFPTFNTMPFISRISDSDTTEGFLKSTKSRLNHIRRTQRLDVETIGSINSACRDSCRYNSILVIQQDESTNKQSGLFDSEHLVSFETTQSAPLVLECTPTGSKIVFKMKYDPVYVASIDAEIMLHHLKTAFEELSSGTEKQLNHINLFNQRDLQCVKDWVVPSLSLERTTLHSLVEDSARARPDAVAIWQTDRSLTYNDLIDQSRKVMTKVSAVNCEVSQNIGVCFEKSAYAVVAMLGVSMAGHAFVPMDASNPFNRLMQLVENADMNLVICSPSMSSKFQEANINTIVVDDDAIANIVDDGTAPHSDPEGNVYIIYTSGSTGVPKGVTMTHQALCTTLKAISDHLEFSADTRDLQFSSFAFDMSVHDIWCTLLKGGVVCIPTDAERFELEEFIPRAECNYAMLTPSVALTLSEKSWKSFRKLSTSGEPLPKAVFQSALQAGVKFWNTYGPTESCVICITEQIKTMDTSPSRLGYSMAATSWIIDADDPHRLAPVGCVGELVLTGHTLAAGYYRDEEKTEQAFMAGLEWTKQFPDHPLDKVYRTGDLARYQSDGSIEFHGRLGGYIKIAGNRVDLGEVEYVLHSKCDLPKVSVQYCKVGNTDARDILVSFCAFPSKRPGEASEVLPMEDEMKRNATKSFKKLRELLPSFMIPAAFIPISRFPYNTAGKLDKKRLVGLIADRSVDHLLDEYGIETQTGDDSQDDSDEEVFSSEALTMRNTWAAVLKMNPDKISDRSNFFRLGGDSLRAMNLGAKLRQSGHSISASDVFKYPVLIDMAGRMKTVTSEKADVVLEDVWSPEEDDRISAAATEALHLSRSQIESVLPCTSLQTQMLAASAQSSSTYLHRECFELSVDVSDSETTRVCQTLSSNNELLRSKAFVDQETGQFVLVVLNAAVPIALSHKKSSLEHYLESDQEPLGIEHDLARFVVLEDGQRRILVWEMHHSIFDGYSNVLLRQQMRDAIARNRRSDTNGTLETQTSPKFHDFVQYLNHADRQEAENFWSGYLQGAPEPSLPFARPDRGVRATNAKTTYELEYEAPRSSFTSAIYIRAAFALTLSQYMTNSDVCFAATNNGRELPVENIQKLAGPTFSTLPVRCVLNKDEKIGALLSRLQVEAAEITSYQYLSTEEISSIDGNCKQACQFTMHLLIQPDTEESLFEELGNHGYRTIPDVSPMNLQIPFNLVATTKAHSMRFDVIYNNELFPTEHIEMLFDQFSTNLKSVLSSDESKCLRDLYDLGEANRRLCLTVQPKEADQDKYAGSTIPELVFHQRLGAKANDPALYSTRASFTYGEMYAIASALAEKISAHVGASGHQYIAVCYEKSPSAIMAQLAVLMAGHTYVSVDASWPATRRDVILKQINCSLLIASPHMSSMLQDVTTTIITFDADNAERRALEFEQSFSHAQPENAAYVIFTSGTTGTPKGVVVQHDAICRTLSAYAERLKFTDETKALLFASFSFDASVMETWSVLAAGGTLCIADDDERISDMDGFLDRSGADCVGLTPTSAMLLDASRHETIKTLLFCGEKCHARDLERWNGRDLALVNAYGPSETSVNAVMNTQFSPADLNNIGSSMGGGLWVVDPSNHDQLVPVGAVGELLVTGPVLAKEYLNDAEKTAQKFVRPQWPSWTKMKGVKAYKTGDLVRLDIDGSLRFIGRHDGQMKINGIRIEANEIESAASQSDAGVGETAVGLFSLGDETHELAMFFVPYHKTKASNAEILPLQKDHAQTIMQLHTHLTSVLPRSHVPSLYVPISAVPQSASGKIDRKALSQALELLHPAQVDLYRPQDHTPNASKSNTALASPSTPKPELSSTETTLISLWAQVLHRGKSDAPLNRESHFTRSGGDSVSAIRLSSLARSKGIELPVSTIYANAILADMAAAVDGAETTGESLDDLVSPAPFELVQGMDLSPASPQLSRGVSRAASDYFGSMVR